MYLLNDSYSKINSSTFQITSSKINKKDTRKNSQVNYHGTELTKSIFREDSHKHGTDVTRIGKETQVEAQSYNDKVPREGLKLNLPIHSF